MPKYIISAGCSFSDTFNTDFKLYNDFVAEYLDAELISLGIGGTGNQFIAHTFMNNVKQKLDSGVSPENIFGIVQWSMIHRYAFVSGEETISGNPNMHLGKRVIYPRTFTDYDSMPMENEGWLSIAPWSTDQAIATETPDLHHLSTEYYTNLQNTHTDILNTLTLYSLVKSFCETHNVKVIFTWLDEGNREAVTDAQPQWMFNHLTDHIKDSINLPAIRQEVMKYEKINSDVWCENDYQGHPNELGHKLYFETIIRPRLENV
jgi:hypothetical protein